MNHTPVLHNLPAEDLGPGLANAGLQHIGNDWFQPLCWGKHRGRDTVTRSATTQQGYISRMGLDGTSPGRQSLGGSSWTHQTKLPITSTENTLRARKSLWRTALAVNPLGVSIISHNTGTQDLPSGISVPCSFGIFGGMLFSKSSLTFFLLGKALTIPRGSIGLVGKLAAIAKYKQERARLLRSYLTTTQDSLMLLTVFVVLKFFVVSFQKCSA